jgi:hypothetical protein
MNRFQLTRRRGEVGAHRLPAEDLRRVNQVRVHLGLRRIPRRLLRKQRADLLLGVAGQFLRLRQTEDGKRHGGRNQRCKTIGPHVLSASLYM